MTPHPAGGTPGHGRPPLTSAQRRALTGADRESGEVRAGAATLAGLAALGLARPYGRLGAHYLTATGRALRESLVDPDPAGASTDADSAGFSPDAGGGPFHSAPGRAEAVARAWHSLLEIRRLTGAGRDGGPLCEPAAWERSRPAHAVALALEAAGLAPSAQDGSGRRNRTGYRVMSTGERGAVRVEWRLTAGDSGAVGGRDGLEACARALARCGWESERYTDSRRRPFLLVLPPSRR